MNRKLQALLLVATLATNVAIAPEYAIAYTNSDWSGRHCNIYLGDGRRVVLQKDESVTIPAEEGESATVETWVEIGWFKHPLKPVRKGYRFSLREQQAMKPEYYFGLAMLSQVKKKAELNRDASRTPEGKMRITLLDPRYPHGGRRTYLAGGLMNLGSRLMRAGYEVGFADLNHSSLIQTIESTNPNFVGFSVLGPPYIPGVIANIGELREAGFDGRVLVGGEGVARVATSDFGHWFASLGDVVQIKNDADLAAALGTSELASAYETSMVPMLEQLSAEQRKLYLGQEFALFLSQGCKFNCRFCAASKAMRERYRSQESLEEEVRYIASELERMGHDKLECYLSSLDVLQTPRELEPRLCVINSIASTHGLEVHLRSLATSISAVEVEERDPGFLRRMRHYGLRTIGYGADGADSEVWLRENKKHNNLADLRSAIELTRDAGMTAEVLMVFGFKDDKPRNIWHDVKFSFEQVLAGAVMRPYLGKSHTPSGNWEGADSSVFADAEMLKRLDYSMIGSRQTHPVASQRRLANAAYLGLIAALAPFGKCPTRPLLPVAESGVTKILSQLVNRVMPFDR